jgi:hypothetical protein
VPEPAGTFTPEDVRSMTPDRVRKLFRDPAAHHPGFAFLDKAKGEAVAGPGKNLADQPRMMDLNRGPHRTGPQHQGTPDLPGPPPSPQEIRRGPLTSGQARGDAGG